MHAQCAGGHTGRQSQPLQQGSTQHGNTARTHARSGVGGLNHRCTGGTAAAREGVWAAAHTPRQAATAGSWDATESGPDAEVRRRGKKQTNKQTKQN
eukprot:TRINITY_DN10476_c0_g1_i4.p4 TRINITY_DN10476_c0_g1~~TRINITY_DN10476_c0_g1_i4.p4  ORF type:complete len:114 (-),score=5.04 TRINITY_DN10476_c0_g1_i4:436-726(-)